eukprot:180367-Pelagomonas_calceolata.AAC.4
MAHFGFSVGCLPFGKQSLVQGHAPVSQGRVSDQIYVAMWPFQGNQCFDTAWAEVFHLCGGLACPVYTFAKHMPAYSKYVRCSAGNCEVHSEYV